MTPTNRTRSTLGQVVATPSEQPQAVDYFGGCPQCGYHDGYLNVERVHWFVCHEHRVRWSAGSNLFSSWRAESVPLWRANIERMAGYTEVEPLMPPNIDHPREELPVQVIGALEAIHDFYSPAAQASYLESNAEQREGHICESLAIVYGWLNGIAEPVRWMRMQLGVHRQVARPYAEAGDR